MPIEASKRLKILILIMLLLIIVGTVGYRFLLNVSIIDALYMTVITISTVGYTEVGEMDEMAKLFSILIIFTGLGTVGYAFSRAATLLIDGAFKESWRKKKMEKHIMDLRDHYILCGAGETGQSVIEQFLNRKVPFVVIEQNDKVVQNLMDRGIFVVHGDGTHEKALEDAQIYHAKGLISALSDDSDNVFTVLTARQMNDNLYIVSRAVEKNSIEKLKKAGANNTISPNEIGGMRMASFVTRPAIISFLDIITRAGDVILDLEDVVICDQSSLKGQTLKEAKIPEKTGLIVLALQKKDESTPLLNPSSNEILRTGDTMIVLGQEEQVDKLRKLGCDDGKRNPAKQFRTLANFKKK